MDVEKSRVIFDPIYGFIKLTNIEYEIIHSPFYQRLRWIKQLGFSFYVFPGAEHSRFGHSIGVMFNAHKILQSCGRAVSDADLFNPKCLTKEAVYHKSLRIGALLHDLGTFCFSHTTETSYIRFGETTKSKNGKGLKDDHENLGSFIIKNTDYPGGITHILKKYGLDPQTVSDLVKGVDPSIMANQILHSEIDCDRMDYLLRDAHYTGLKYGSYDRDYLLYHFQPVNVGGHDILTIRHNALHSVEDFLNSRFAWYSQVIRSARGARYDAIAERLCAFFLEKGLIYRYSDLLEMIAKDPMRFFGFNDSYFMGLVHENYLNGTLDKYPKIKDMAKALLLKTGARAIRCDEFKQRLLNQEEETANMKIYKRAEQKVQEIQDILDKKGGPEDWILPDLPKKDIIFVRSPKLLAKDAAGAKQNLLLERDPVKISYENGEVKLLADVEDSIISRLYNSTNYTPNVFCSESAYRLLVQEGVIEA
ncbi:HD domain-containing protein [Halobacteriovorax sp. GB3]|uniref:HD domain-containing protein n=1 Tax=Halobacteriovorax sp. GB3 TaxID=2719615 RepID=UPI00235DE79B|nr:HD domain-containing protein [Halobacteriovorax sp. GB3]MDD0853887.1 HD domain-containing protein [Halobacteriovorax sp. GB3]